LATFNIIENSIRTACMPLKRVISWRNPFFKKRCVL